MNPQNWHGKKNLPREPMEFLCNCEIEELQKAISLDEFFKLDEAAAKGGEADEQTKAIRIRADRTEQICKLRTENSGLIEKYRRK